MFVHHNSDFLYVCASDCVQRKTDRERKTLNFKRKRKQKKQERGKEKERLRGETNSERSK